MFIKYRPIRQRDLIECLDCIRDGFAYDLPSRIALTDFWRELLRTGAGVGAVMEDLTAPKGHGIVRFVICVFISDDFACYLKTDAPPLVGRHLLGAWIKGAPPHMSPSQIRFANAGAGLNILILHAGSPTHVLCTEKRRLVADRAVAFLSYLMSGYRCHEVLEEVYDEFSCRWAAGAGFRLRKTCPDIPAMRIHPQLPTEIRPHLFGVTSEEAEASAGTLASVLFGYRPPKFHFTLPEQELLIEALGGETDDDLAAALGVAVVTVRKRWSGIYDRVGCVSPWLLPEDATPHDAMRSQEKKRRVLQYVRQHMEELRPIDSPLIKPHAGRSRCPALAGSAVRV